MYGGVEILLHAFLILSIGTDRFTIDEIGSHTHRTGCFRALMPVWQTGLFRDHKIPLPLARNEARFSAVQAGVVTDETELIRSLYVLV